VVEGRYVLDWTSYVVVKIVYELDITSYVVVCWIYVVVEFILWVDWLFESKNWLYVKFWGEVELPSP